jgi:hypothetical protein
VSTAADRAAGLRPQPPTVTAAARQYLHTEAGGAVLLLLATVLALIWANSPWAGSYERFWETPLSLQLGDSALTESLRHWVNDSGYSRWSGPAARTGCGCSCWRWPSSTTSPPSA